MPVDSKFRISSAIIGLIGGSTAAAVIGYFSSSTIEREKFDYALVQQALEADASHEREQRLNFIIDMGFISNTKWTENLLSKLKEKPEDIPQLPKISPSNQPPNKLDIKPFSMTLISNFFSTDYGTRSKAYGEIISIHSNNPGVLITLLSSAPNYFNDNNAVINTLSITKYFSDQSIFQAKLPVDIFLNKITSLIEENPDQWTQTKIYAAKIKNRIEELEAK